MRRPGRGRDPWPRLPEAALVDALQAGGAVLDAGQRQTVRLLTGGAGPVGQGVYLHGGVGRGKTWIAAHLYEALELPKVRLHMHALLGRVNAVLAAAPAGSPLDVHEAVGRLVGNARFVFIDEFHVHDVGDAMLLRRVLPGLLATGAGLLLTSNYREEELLPNPLFHHAILPVVAMIHEHLRTWRIPDGTDYRQITTAAGGFASGSWTVVPTAGTGRRESGPVEPAPGRPEPVEVPVGSGGSRTLRVTAADPDGGVLVASFEQLCAAPVSVQDYLGLAATYSRWRLTDVPSPERLDPQHVQRLAFLVDVLVDADRRLDVEAALPLADWRRGEGQPRDADRFHSRLSLLRPR